jgi:hypothetical protein
MIRFLLRTLGVLCLAAAFVALVVDGTRSIASREIVTTSLETSLSQVSPPSLAFVQGNVQAQPQTVRELAALLLRQPTIAVFGVLGIVLVLLGRRRHRHTVGFAT